MKSEAAIQNELRVLASERGMRLWRNISGAVTTDDGRHIRFGLGNESAEICSVMKSSDLIGITPLVIGPEHVGRTIGVFTATEVKKQGWKYTGTDREKAQYAFIMLVLSLGGIAKFSTGDL